MREQERVRESSRNTLKAKFEGGRRGNPAWLSQISLWPRVPSLKTPNHGQGWNPNRPEGFKTSSRNREPSTQPFSPAAWTPFHGPWGNPAFPDSSTRKEDSKGLGRFLLLHRPQKGPQSKRGGVLKDIPKSKYLKC